MPWPTTSRHARGYGTAWDGLRKLILVRDNHVCQMHLAKGIIASGNHVDHKIPKAKGGTDDPDNLWTLCRPCHDEKTLADEGKWIKPEIGLDGWPVA